jgi:hypothetical protein
MPNRKRDSEGRFASGSFIDAMKDRPYATAAVAAGAAAAGAFLWSKRDRISEAASSGMDKFSELKSQRMGSRRSQEDISEEALTLKETGKKSRGPRGPISQQDIKSGMAVG